MAKKNATNENDTIDLPEVKDIPGQENVKPPYMGEMADTTASSAGEEGDAIFNNTQDQLGEDDLGEDELGIKMGMDPEDESLTTSGLDQVDEDGDPLNESTGGYDFSGEGEDLDTPGMEEDDSEDEA